MSIHEKLGISKDLLNDLIHIFLKYPEIEKVKVFGIQSIGKL